MTRWKLVKLIHSHPESAFLLDNYITRGLVLHWWLGHLSDREFSRHLGAMMGFWMATQ